MAARLSDGQPQTFGGQQRVRPRFRSLGKERAKARLSAKRAASEIHARSLASVEEAARREELDPQSYEYDASAYHPAKEPGALRTDLPRVLRQCVEMSSC
jgi:hypothetical protein